jgi:hypothetical protein
MRIRHPYIWISFFIIILVTILLLFSGKLLSKHHPINSKILVIEGWVPSYVLEELAGTINLSSYQEIILVGLSHKSFGWKELPGKSKRIYPAHLPGTLYYNAILYSDSIFPIVLQNDDALRSITVYAYGSQAVSFYPNFSVFVNDTLIGSSFTDETSKPYTFHLSESIKSLKSIAVFYGNDFDVWKQDRNLYIDSIKLNTKVLKNGIFSIYTKDIESGYNYFPFKSSAEFDHTYLKSLGISINPTVLDTNYDGRNRTLIEAQKLTTYLKHKYHTLPSVNILSVDGHSLRSYISFKTAFGKNNGGLGIISFKNRTNHKGIWETLGTLGDEYIKLMISYLIYIKTILFI